MKNVFSVYDTKAGVFSNPFFSTNKNTALRDFSSAYLDPASHISMYPHDFILYEIGTFNEDTGELTPMLPISLGTADQFNPKEG